MKVRIKAVKGRENLQFNLRNITIEERTCNSVEKHKMVLLTETPCKVSISESTELKRLRVLVGNNNLVE